MWNHLYWYWFFIVFLKKKYCYHKCTVSNNQYTLFTFPQIRYFRKKNKTTVEKRAMISLRLRHYVRDICSCVLFFRSEQFDSCQKYIDLYFLSFFPSIFIVYIPRGSMRSRIPTERNSTTVCRIWLFFMESVGFVLLGLSLALYFENSSLAWPYIRSHWRHEIDQYS